MRITSGSISSCVENSIRTISRKYFCLNFLEYDEINDDFLGFEYPITLLLSSTVIRVEDFMVWDQRDEV